MLVETGVLGGDYGVLEFGGNLGERDEFVPFLIGLAMAPGLYPTLHL
jgi:hypothetical protein